MVLDTGTSIYVWLGAHANALEVNETTAFVQKYIEVSAAMGMAGARGGSTLEGGSTAPTIVNIPCGAEPIEFTMHFAAWQQDLFLPYLQEAAGADVGGGASGGLLDEAHMKAEVAGVLSMGDELVRSHGAFITSDALHEQLVDIHSMISVDDANRQIGGGMAAEVAAMAAKRKQTRGGGGYVIMFSRPDDAPRGKKKPAVTQNKRAGSGLSVRRGSFVKTTPRRSVFEGGIRREGELEKKAKGVLKGQWQRRYFTCQGHYLRYKSLGDDDSPREERAIADATATKGVIDLNAVTKLELKCGSAAAEDGDGASAKIVITSEGPKGCIVVKLRAQTQAEGEAWVDAMIEGMDCPLERGDVIQK
jgi:hypothetical protein